MTNVDRFTQVIPSRTRHQHVRTASVLLAVDASARDPLHVQISRAFRDAIVTGRLGAGARVPSSRALATDLGVSRNTALLATSQLVAEGYLVTRVGSGTRVAAILPDDLLHAPARAAPEPPTSHHDAARTISRRGARAAAIGTGSPRIGTAPRPFRPGTPALDQFPTDQWARLAGRRYGRLSYEMLELTDPAGYRPLRDAIATYVRASRGVRCTPDQVIVTAGAQQALALAAHVLLDPGDVAWMEDPGYLGMRGALTAAAACLAPIPVDGEGLDVAAGIRAAPDARLVYVTPSHQFPLGVTMSQRRRTELLQWARRSGAWIVEDDYDNEYRFSGRPLPALQGLDDAGRVLYVGTFTKTMFPALRLGYLIVPHDLVGAFVSARGVADGHAPTLDQAVMADFMADGGFARHIRRMRTLYAARRAQLIAAIDAQLPDAITLAPSNGGLHLVAWLAPAHDDVSVSMALRTHGVEAPPLSMYAVDAAPARGALLLGYAPVDTDALTRGMRALRRVLRPDA